MEQPYPIEYQKFIYSGNVLIIELDVERLNVPDFVKEKLKHEYNFVLKVICLVNFNNYEFELDWICTLKKDEDVENLKYLRAIYNTGCFTIRKIDEFSKIPDYNLPIFIKLLESNHGIPVIENLTKIGERFLICECGQSFKNYIGPAHYRTTRHAVGCLRMEQYNSLFKEEIPPECILTEADLDAINDEIIQSSQFDYTYQYEIAQEKFKILKNQHSRKWFVLPNLAILTRFNN